MWYYSRVGSWADKAERERKMVAAAQEYTDVAQVGTEVADGEKTIYLAVRALAGVCDGASTLDGHGFNGRDAQFGNSIADKPWEQWTYKMRLAAHKMLRTYKNTQLPAFGIDYDAIPVPTMPRCTTCGKETERGPLCRGCWQQQHDPAPPLYVRPQAAAQAAGPKVYDDSTMLGDITEVELQAFRDGARCVAGASNDGSNYVILFDTRHLLDLPRAGLSYDNADSVKAMWEAAAVVNRKLSELTGIGPSTPGPKGGQALPVNQQQLQAVPDVHQPKGTPSTVTVEKVGDQMAFCLRFHFERKKVDAVKAIPGRVWDQGLKAWVVRAQIDSLEPLTKVIETFDFQMDPSVAKAIADFSRMFTARVEASHATEASFAVKGLNPDMQLRPFQQAGVRFMTGVKRSLCADDMGLGKTIQAMATIQHLKAYPALIVAPKNVVEKWRREWIKWVPGVHVAVLGSKLPAGWDRCHVCITNYEMLHKHADAFVKANFQAVVIDEAHYIKNPKARRSQAAMNLVEEWETDDQGHKVKQLRSTPVRIALTGTPIENSPIEALNLIKWVGWEREVGGWRFFDSLNKGTGASQLHELNRRLRSLFMIRRTKPQVLTELPPLTRDVLPIELTNKAEYERAEDELAEWAGQRKATNLAAIAQDRKDAEAAGLQPGTDEYTDYLAEAASDRYDRTAEATARAQHLVRFEHLKTLAWEGKREGVYQWIDGLLATGEKLVVFAWHTDAIMEVAKRYDALVITGEVSQVKRQAAMDAFQTDPNTKVIVCNIKAGGVGIDLYAASNVLFIELGWNPGQHRQAEDRLNRMGQQNAVMSYYALGTIDGAESNTIDGEIYNLILEKATVVDAATDGEGQAVQVNVIKDLQARLEARVAARRARKG